MKKILMISLSVFLLIIIGAAYYKSTEELAKDLPVQTTTERQEDEKGTHNISVEIISADVEKSDIAEISYAYPIFSGINDQSVQEKINDDIKNRIVSAADGSRGDVEEFCPSGQEADESLAGWVCRFGYDSEYESFTQYSGKILSVRLETYMYTGGAHGDTVVEFINYDLQSGEKFDWRDTFVSDSDYLVRIAEYAKTELRQKLLEGEYTMTEEEWIETGSMPSPENYNTNVGFSEDALLVVYQSYQVAPYALGQITVLIPYDKLRGIVDSEGLLGINI